MRTVEVVSASPRAWQSGEVALLTVSRKVLRSGLFPQPGRSPGNEVVPLAIQSRPPGAQVGVVVGSNALVLPRDAIGALVAEGVGFEGVYLVECAADRWQTYWCHPKTVVTTTRRVDASLTIYADGPPPDTVFFVDHPDQPIALGPFFGKDDSSPYAWARANGVLTSMLSYSWIES